MNINYIPYYMCIVFIIIGEIIRRLFFKNVNIILFAWMIIGILIIYILSIAIIHRKEIQKKNINDIDRNKDYNIFSKDLIIDIFVIFGNNNDKRYLDPNNMVYLGEFINIILSIILIYLIITKKSMSDIKYVLYGQIILSSIYYLTYTQYKFDTIDNILGSLSVSPWLIIPTIILIQNKQK